MSRKKKNEPTSPVEPSPFALGQFVKIIEHMLWTGLYADIEQVRENGQHLLLVHKNGHSFHTIAKTREIRLVLWAGDPVQVDLPKAVLQGRP